MAGHDETARANASGIEMDGVTKRYGSVSAIEGLDLRVERGEVFGFLGPNGSGKTTTIRLLLDLIRPTSGRLRVLGKDPRSDGASLRRRIGYVPGDLALYRGPARSTLRYFADLRRAPTDRIEELAERLELDLDRPAEKLSRGNRQKVGLIQAFFHEPELLLLDEPTSGLDPLMQRVFEELVREATGRGATVFLSSHVLSEVQETADRAGIIRAGRLVAVEDVRNLRSKAMRHMEVRFASAPPVDAFRDLPGVTGLELHDRVLRCRVRGSIDPLLKALARHEVESLSAHDVDLEDVFMTYYGAPDAA